MIARAGRRPRSRCAVPAVRLPLRWHWIALAALFVPLSFVLVQCGKAPSAGMLAANAQSSAKSELRPTTFDDRFPAPQFSGPLPDRQ